jgi:hypothetical protein
MSGREASGDPDGVLELDRGDAVLLRHSLQRLARAEQRECVLDPGSAAGEMGWPNPRVGSTTTSAVSYAGRWISRA